MEYIELNNGVRMPKEGYGVFRLDPAECERCVSDALATGYRLIDTAQAYNNEKAVGSAVAKSGIDRKDIFLVSKIWLSDYGYEKAKASIDESLSKLGTEYIDLMLLHQPFCDRYGAYRALEDAYKEGKLRAIGVSNFMADHLIDLSYNMEIPPMVNQVQAHVFHQEVELQKVMQEFGTQMMAWAPLGEGMNGFFTDPVLTAIGKKYGKTVAQVALRWLTQRDIVAIPKSVRKERMAENIDIFDFTISDEDMAEIARLDNTKDFKFDYHSAEVTKMFMGWRESFNG